MGGWVGVGLVVVVVVVAGGGGILDAGLIDLDRFPGSFPLQHTSHYGMFFRCGCVIANQYFGTKDNVLCHSDPTATDRCMSVQRRVHTGVLRHSHTQTHTSYIQHHHSTIVSPNRPDRVLPTQAPTTGP